MQRVLPAYLKLAFRLNGGCAALLLFALLSSAACSSSVVSAAANPNMTGSATEASTQSANASATPWGTGQSAVVMYGIDTALNDMYIFAPTTGSNAQNVNTTSSCGTSFDSNGIIAISGTYTPQSGAFDLSISLTNCPLDGPDGVTYLVEAAGLAVKGAVTSTPEADGTVNNVFQTTVTGSPSVTNKVASLTCALNVANAVTYNWGANLNISGNYSGTFCDTQFTGTVKKLLPVVTP